MTTNRTASRVWSLGAAFARSAARWLCFAASPTFAIMALVTAASGISGMDCMTGQSPLAGMAPMYLLMSAFHLAPWLRLASGVSIPAG
jgi:hypothetical protein